MRTTTLFLLLTQLAVAATAFTPQHHRSTSSTASTALNMADASDDDNFMKWARAARYATDEDEVIELPRPLGIVLNQDPSGNVFVEKIAPKGNAARTGKVGIAEKLLCFVWYCVG